MPDNFEGNILPERWMPYDSGHDRHDLRQVVFDWNHAASKLPEESGHRRVHKDSNAELSWNDVSFFSRVKSLNCDLKNLLRIPVLILITCRLKFGLEIESKTTSVVGWRSRLCCGIKGSTYTRWTGEVTRASEVPWHCSRFGFVSTTCAVDLLPSIVEYRVKINSAMSSVFNKARLNSQNQNKLDMFS